MRAIYTVLLCIHNFTQVYSQQVCERLKAGGLIVQVYTQKRGLLSRTFLTALTYKTRQLSAFIYTHSTQAYDVN